MRVALVSNLYPPETVGGAERHVRTVARRLVDRGHDVAVVTTGDPDAHPRTRFEAEHDDGVEVHRFAPLNLYAPIDHQGAAAWRKPLFHLLDLWNPQVYGLVRRWVRRHDPDVVHVHNFGGLSNAVFAACGHADRVLHTLHDYSLIHVHASMFVDGEIVDPGGLMGPYQRFNRATVEPHVDRVLAPSQFIIDQHRRQGLLRDLPATCLPLGVDTEAIPDVSPAPTDADDGVFRCLYAGQLTVQKGVDVLVEALRGLDCDGVRLDVLGKGPERNRLESLASDDPRIRFRGFVSERELHRAFRRADATVVPSRWYENSPMVIYESYTHGTPVIGADIGGIPELIDEGETGFLFEPDSVPSLRSRLRTARRAVDAEMESAVRARSDRFALETHVDDLVRIYGGAG